MVIPNDYLSTAENGYFLCIKTLTTRNKKTWPNLLNYLIIWGDFKLKLIV